MNLGELQAELRHFAAERDWQPLHTPKNLAMALMVEAAELAAMIYFYARDRAKARERLARAHSALGDVQNCRALLHYQLADLRDRGELHADSAWDDVWRISERARIPKVMPFGKHKGERIADIPDDYRSRLLRQPDVDPYLHQALLGDAQLF